MEYIEMHYDNVAAVNSTGITFANGERIVFADCTGARYTGDRCVAERNIEAAVPYFEFSLPDSKIMLCFAEKGLFAKSKNRRSFIEFQHLLESLGYTTYDLS